MTGVDEKRAKPGEWRCLTGLFLPLIGVILGGAIDGMLRVTPDDWGWGRLGSIIKGVGAGAAVGLWLALTGLLRQERRKYIGYAALLLNAGILLIALTLLLS